MMLMKDGYYYGTEESDSMKNSFIQINKLFFIGGNITGSGIKMELS